MAIYHKTLQYHEDTTEKRSLNDEDIKFLMELQKEMNTQDTTETAEPRFWVIKGSERVQDDENADELVLQADGSTVTSTTEETVKYLNDNILSDCNINRENCKIGKGCILDFILMYTEDGEEEYEDLIAEEVNEFLANNGYDVSDRKGSKRTSGTKPLPLFRRCTYLLHVCLEISGSMVAVEDIAGGEMG